MSRGRQQEEQVRRVDVKLWKQMVPETVPSPIHALVVAESWQFFTSANQAPKSSMHFQKKLIPTLG